MGVVGDAVGSDVVGDVVWRDVVGDVVGHIDGDTVGETVGETVGVDSKLIILFCLISIKVSEIINCLNLLLCLLSN